MIVIQAGPDKRCQSFIYHFVTLADHQEGELASKKVKQLQTELDTTKHMSRSKDLQISSLEAKLQAEQEKLSALRHESEESSGQGEQKLLSQKGYLKLPSYYFQQKLVHTAVE